MTIVGVGAGASINFPCNGNIVYFGDSGVGDSLKTAAVDHAVVRYEW